MIITDRIYLFHSDIIGHHASDTLFTPALARSRATESRIFLLITIENTISKPLLRRPSTMLFVRSGVETSPVDSSDSHGHVFGCVAIKIPGKDMGDPLGKR